MSCTSWRRIKEEYLKPLGGFLLLPYLLYREVREQILLWKAKPHTPLGGKARETREIKALLERLSRYSKDAQLGRERLCREVVEKVFTDSSSPAALAAFKLLTEIAGVEGFLTVPVIEPGGGTLSTSEMWEKESELRRSLDSFENPEVLVSRLEKLLRGCVLDSDLSSGRARESGEAMFSVPLYTLLPSPVMAVERVLGEIVTEARADSPFYHLWLQLKQNMFIASGIDPGADSSREPVWPSSAKMEVEEMIDAYLGNTPFVSFFRTGVPFDVF